MFCLIIQKKGWFPMIAAQSKNYEMRRGFLLHYTETDRGQRSSMDFNENCSFLPTRSALKIKLTMVNVKCIQSPKHLLYIKQKTTFEAANKPLEPAGNTAFSTRWPPLLPHQQNNQSYVTCQIWLIPTRKHGFCSQFLVFGGRSFWQLGKSDGKNMYIYLKVFKRVWEI